MRPIQQRQAVRFIPVSVPNRRVQSGSMLLKNSRDLVFESDSIPDDVVAQAAPYDL
jgi:hypothetical protein